MFKKYKVKKNENEHEVSVAEKYEDIKRHIAYYDEKGYIEFNSGRLGSYDDVFKKLLEEGYKIKRLENTYSESVLVEVSWKNQKTKRSQPMQNIKQVQAISFDNKLFVLGEIVEVRKQYDYKIEHTGKIIDISEDGFSIDCSGKFKSDIKEFKYSEISRIYKIQP